MKPLWDCIGGFAQRCETDPDPRPDPVSGLKRKTTTTFQARHSVLCGARAPPCTSHGDDRAAYRT